MVDASFIAAMTAIDDEALAAMKGRADRFGKVTEKINEKILGTLGTGLNYADITGSPEPSELPASSDGQVIGRGTGVNPEGGGGSPATELVSGDVPKQP